MLKDKKIIGLILESEDLEHLNLITILEKDGNRSDFIRSIISNYLQNDAISKDMACSLIKQRISNKWQSIKYITREKDHAYEHKNFLNYWKHRLIKMGIGHELIESILDEVEL